MREGEIPKRAVKPLIELCNRLGKETGKTAADLFEHYLKLMKKYSDYVFSEDWPQRRSEQFGLSDRECKFIDENRSFKEKVERFTVVLLKRNMSMEGFDSENFIHEFDWYGRLECWFCVVPHVMWLRQQVKLVEQARKENEEEMKKEEPSVLTREMFEYYNKPEVIRSDKMRGVELRFLEEVGNGKDRSCKVENNFRCPYGEESKLLEKDGKTAKTIWEIVEWYDHYWNRSLLFTPGESEMKWYHWNEPSIIDVASYDDVLKAIEDGRMEKILEEWKRYKKEHEEQASAE